MMTSRKKTLILILSVAAFMMLAVPVVVRYRFVRIKKLEVVDSEVYAILGKAVDSLKLLSSNVRNTSLFVTTTENSVCFHEDFPGIFAFQSGTAGYIKVNGTNVFLDEDLLGNDIPAVFSSMDRQSLFRVLSLDGYAHDIEHVFSKDDTYYETKVEGYYKYINGHWEESSWKETVGEQEEKEAERWRQEHPDTLVFMAPVAPAFAEKYDSLTDKNFSAFLKDWERWSAQMNSLSKDSLLNTILTKVHTEYRATKEEDSCAFLSFSDVIEVRRYQGKAKDYPANQEDVWQDDVWQGDRDEDYKYMMKASGRYCYVPAINSDKEILYVSPEIQRLLSLYIGGVCESEEDDIRDHEKWTKINENRLSGLRRLIHVDSGHWGGHWHFKTMPIVFSIYLFDDGYVVDMRTSWHSGETVFYPYDPSQEKIIYSSWIE